MFNLSVDLMQWDPDILDVVVNFLSVAVKYGGFFGISGFCIRMLIKAFSGKERFI